MINIYRDEKEYLMNCTWQLCKLSREILLSIITALILSNFSDAQLLYGWKKIFMNHAKLVHRLHRSFSHELIVTWNSAVNRSHSDCSFSLTFFPFQTRNFAREKNIIWSTRYIRVSLIFRYVIVTMMLPTPTWLPNAIQAYLDRYECETIFTDPAV